MRMMRSAPVLSIVVVTALAMIRATSGRLRCRAKSVGELNPTILSPVAASLGGTESPIPKCIPMSPEKNAAATRGDFARSPKNDTGSVLKKPAIPASAVPAAIARITTKAAKPRSLRFLRSDREDLFAMQTTYGDCTRRVLTATLRFRNGAGSDASVHQIRLSAPVSRPICLSCDGLAMRSEIWPARF